MQGLVQDDQLWVFDKGTGQQRQTLFTTRQLQEGTVCQRGNAKDVHPPATALIVLWGRYGIESDGVHQTTGHNADDRQVALVRTVHLRGHIANVLLDVPDALPGTSRTVKQGDVTGIALWIVGTDE